MPSVSFSGNNRQMGKKIAGSIIVTIKPARIYTLQAFTFKKIFCITRLDSEV